MSEQNDSNSPTAAELRAAGIDARIKWLWHESNTRQTQIARAARTQYERAKALTLENGLEWSGSAKAIADQDFKRSRAKCEEIGRSTELRVAELKCRRDAL